MSRGGSLTEKQLQDEADEIMAEGNDEVLSCISEKIPEPFSDSEKSFAPSLPNSSSAEDLHSSDESVNNDGTAQEDVNKKVENNTDV
ncbi:hypothetical protein JTB14_030658 [Gonioctena quinquepunctata]|nr:hypothetical protein JTB14_030658 [Gonioctena quinquepunctata]